ncbi:hypothetical protein Tco_0644118 [Tanacetum coccineum]
MEQKIKENGKEFSKRHKEGLEEFSLCSGLVPNLKKSTGFFGNVNVVLKKEIMKILPFKEGKLPIRYLGVQLVIRKINVTDCKCLIDKVKLRINDWKNSTHSLPGLLCIVDLVRKIGLLNGLLEVIKDEACFSVKSCDWGVIIDWMTVFGVFLCWYCGLTMFHKPVHGCHGVTSGSGPVARLVLSRASLNRLPIRPNLAIRGVFLPTTLCSFFEEDIEDLDHCIINCSRVLDIWRKVWSWWNLDMLSSPSPILP